MFQLILRDDHNKERIWGEEKLENTTSFKSKVYKTPYSKVSSWGFFAFPNKSHELAVMAIEYGH